ncbi:MAG: protein translocase subunit SecD [Candidatus Eisenbacteria bacterium]|nr:protein translocase subunit SecD [Candidatus Eisenbacteria bacterium]
MNKNRYRLILVLAALLLGAWYVYPTLRFHTLSTEEREAMGEKELSELRSKALRLGLDLQGGMHLVLQVDRSNLSGDEASDATDRALEIIRNRVDQFGVAEPSIQRQGGDRIVVQLPGVQDALQAKSLIGQTALLEFKLLRSAAEFTETLRRIDDFLYARSKDAEVPEDTLALSPDEEAMKKTPLTARLRFFRSGEQDNAWVPEEQEAAVESLLAIPGVRGLVPFGAAFVWGREFVDYGGTNMKALYLVSDKPELTGASVSNAVVSMGLDQTRPNSPGVSLTLTGEGAHDFSRITGANVGRRLAIVLDGKIHVAPTIMGKIPRGRASITGNYDMDEAKILSIVLRAGALPAPLEIIEERTVGPSLGRDSIRLGVNAAIFGVLCVAIFMLIYYRLSGLYATVALILNLILILAVMSALRATLTLPGIAGIILTIGMAVDSNVLIFERIREELRNRKTVRASIEAGYTRAFRTILDSNVTTLISALVLLQFGTANIKGFAVTLSVGIVSSMFTAIVVTRMIFDFIVNRYSPTKLSI